MRQNHFLPQGFTPDPIQGKYLRTLQECVLYKSPLEHVLLRSNILIHILLPPDPWKLELYLCVLVHIWIKGEVGAVKPV